METQLWSQKVGEKTAYYLTLRGDELLQHKVSGSKFTIRKNVARFLEAIAAGQPPRDADAKVVSEIDVRRITQAEVSPGNGVLTLNAEGPGSTSLNFSPEDDRADLIWDAIRAQSGRDFQPTPTEIGWGEAITPPIILGVIAAIPCGLLYASASQIASGEEVEVGGRRRGLQQLLVSIAEALGTGGVLALGAVVLALTIGWALRRLLVRPIKTVWKPASA